MRRRATQEVSHASERYRCQRVGYAHGMAFQGRHRAICVDDPGMASDPDRSSPRNVGGYHRRDHRGDRNWKQDSPSRCHRRDGKTRFPGVETQGIGDGIVTAQTSALIGLKPPSLLQFATAIWDAGRCRRWVIRADFDGSRALPVRPQLRTFSAPVGMSQWCTEADVAAVTRSRYRRSRAVCREFEGPGFWLF
jgi:hypothetical protein